LIASKHLQRILIEESLGQPPLRPDTPDEAAYRLKIREQIAEIRRQGGVIDVPSEWEV
jgi:hypothetical protein